MRAHICAWKDKKLKTISPELLKNAKASIPNGPYCYEFVKTKFKFFKQAISLCPFWDCDKSQEKMQNGYCHYLKQGDWDNQGFGLLWDQCKECGINQEDGPNES